ncbi:F-box protein SKIP28 [Dendrobium catenatum]|nr:F-box protein SKIP28 [Dendrobium catenatum]
METPPTAENVFPNIPAGDAAEPHRALFFVLGYLRLPDRLACRQVCRAFSDEISANETLWRHIIVEPPLSTKIRDDFLLWITSFARGNLKSLALLRCWRVTDASLLHVVDQNPYITKLCIPGCTALTADGVVRAVMRLAEHKGHLECLRLNGLCNIKREHLNVLKSLLCKNKQQEAFHASFYSGWSSLALDSDDGRPIDVDICPKCKNVGMVFDCTREECRTMRNRWSQCRGCFFCIARCEECGGCVDEDELGEDTACPHVLCAGCWLQLPKCDTCNRPCCRQDLNAQALSSAGFVCDQCRDSELL